MYENNFQGISESDMRYLVYLSQNRFEGFPKLGIETDLSAEYRIKELEKQGYILFKNGDICFSFKAITALTDYKDYINQQLSHKKQEHFRFWMPIFINAVLAIVAIIISTIALLTP